MKKINIGKELLNTPSLVDRAWAEEHIFAYVQGKLNPYNDEEDEDEEEEANDENAEDTTYVEDVEDISMQWGSVGIIYIAGVLVNNIVPEDGCEYTDLAEVTEALNTFRGNPTVSTVWLFIDSPGGFVQGLKTLSDLIYDIDAEKPVYAWINGSAFSAAYWLASQCRNVYTNPDGSAGSIGTFSISLDRTKELEQAGITLNIFSEGEGKLAGNCFYTMTKEDKAHFQYVVNKAYNQFVGDIDRKRTVDHGNAKAYTWDADDSVILGLVDGIYPDFYTALTTYKNLN